MHHLVRVDARRDDKFDVVALEEPAQLREDRDHEDDDDDASEDGDGTELTRGDGVADVDVALDRQRHCEPDGRRVERGRNELRQAVVRETPRVWHPVPVATERVEIDVTRYRPDTFHSHRQTSVTSQIRLVYCATV